MKVGYKYDGATSPINTVLLSLHDDDGKWVGYLHHASVVINSEVVERFETDFKKGYDAPRAIGDAKKDFKKRMKAIHGRVFWS
jgi:hypothetical protein